LTYCCNTRVNVIQNTWLVKKNVYYLVLIRIGIISSHLCAIQCRYLWMKRYRKGVRVCVTSCDTKYPWVTRSYARIQEMQDVAFLSSIFEITTNNGTLTRNWNRMFRGRQKCMNSLKRYYASYSYIWAACSKTQGSFWSVKSHKFRTGSNEMISGW
jgi:hypothetical protein